MSISSGGIKVLVIGSITMPLAIIALGLRLWSRSIMNTRLRSSDYLVILAFLFTLTTDGMLFRSAISGAVGNHISDIIATDPHIMVLYIKFNIATQPCWASANTCVKLSILSLYVDIFPKQKFRRVCYATMAVSVCYFISVLLEAFVLCKPVQFNWDKTIPGECHNQNLAYLVAGITNLVIDIVVVALPMPLVFGLQISIAKKFGVAAMFGLGILICVVSLLRVVSLVRWDLSDITWTATPIAIYSLLEPTLGVVNACLPAIKPALYQISNRFPRSQRKNRSRNTDVSRLVDIRSTYHLNPSGLSRGHGFVRFDDDLPLTDIRGSVNRGAEDVEENNTISVTREWAVMSSTQDRSL